ncbi:MAG: hypothetical protein KBT03_06090 [Bacteroidales bacterium]|nr:hypothetical protein [Candidatus Scybalousia scybalohippi]
MNVNGIMLELENVTGLSVEEDYSEEHTEEWITFTYASEYYDEFGDNRPIAEVCDIQIKVTLLKNTDYFELKEKIKDYLLQNEAYDIQCQTYMDMTEDVQKYRLLIISCKFKQDKEIKDV